MKINKPTKLTGIENRIVDARSGCERRVWEKWVIHICFCFCLNTLNFFKFYDFSPLSPILMRKWRKDFGNLLENWIFIPQTVTDFILLGSKITADGDCSHEIKRRLFLGRKAMINLDSVLKSRDITLPTNFCRVKVMVFPVVMYGCKSWTIKKAEHQRINAVKLWCWRRLLRVPWTSRRSNRPILRKSMLNIHWKDQC